MGVFFTSSSSMDKYADFILSVVIPRFYLLSQLKTQSQRLNICVLNILFHALIVSRIVHCKPQKGGSTLFIITLENLGRFLIIFPLL